MKNMSQNRPELVILALKEYLSKPLKEFLRVKYKCIYIERPNKKYPLDKIDLILFSGGPDVSPYMYNETLHKKTSCDRVRDLREAYIFNSYPETIPRLGICRGAQLSCVLSGGSIIQDVSDHSFSHNITTTDNEKFQVTSTHHQMMYPFDISTSDYDIIAHSTRKESRWYENGNNRKIVLPMNFVESEIVYFKKTNSLAIQGHPERDNASKMFKEYTYELIKKLLLNEL